MIAFLLSPLLGAALLAPQSPEPPAPTAKDYRQWQQTIEPDAIELGYEALPWRNRFWPAIEEARKLGRPVLLWTMNGHPLGCT
jgi:hypothetical protein